MFQHLFGVIYHPKTEWQHIRKEKYSWVDCYKNDLVWLAAIPPLSMFIGTTQMGWSVAGGEYVKLTVASALPIAIAFYFALLLGTYVMARAIHWMEKTYGADASFDRCMVLTTYTSAPLFIAGFAGLWPVLWFGVFAGLIAISYTIYLLYSGVETVMEIPEEQAFMFGTSILTVGLVVLVGMIVTTVVLWGMGMMPVFTR